MKIGAIILLLIVIISISSYKFGQYNADKNLLHGFYESSNEFNDESGISSFTMYIGDYKNGKYNTYLLMISNDNEKILINSPTIMSISPMWSFKYNYYKYRVKFSDLNSEFIPNNVILKHYTQSGKIIISDDADTIYGCLFKNPVLTELGIIKNEENVNYNIDKESYVDTDIA